MGRSGRDDATDERLAPELMMIEDLTLAVDEHLETEPTIPLIRLVRNCAHVV